MFECVRLGPRALPRVSSGLRRPGHSGIAMLGRFLWGVLPRALTGGRMGEEEEKEEAEEEEEED